MQASEPLGVTAVRLGYATASQIQQALEQQQARLTRGSRHVPLGVLLQEMKILTREQLIDVLSQSEINQFPVSEDGICLAARIKASCFEMDRSIVVTGAMDGEGASTIAAQIAVSLALMREGRVLLLDANLRSPSLHLRFDVQQTPGLSDVIQGKATLRDAIVGTEIPGLSLLPAGNIVVDFRSLLLSEQCSHIISAARQHFRFVIIDSPPMLKVADTALVATRADGVVLVVSADVRRKSEVAEMKQILDGLKAKVIGTVLFRKASNSYHGKHDNSSAVRSRQPLVHTVKVGVLLFLSASVAYWTWLSFTQPQARLVTGSSLQASPYSLDSDTSPRGNYGGTLAQEEETNEAGAQENPPIHAVSGLAELVTTGYALTVLLKNRHQLVLQNEAKGSE